MSPHHLVALLFAAGPAAASAQTLDLSGKWKGSVPSPQGGDLRVDVSITGTQGSWRMYPPPGSRTGNPCFGREFPLSVFGAPDAELSFQLAASTVISGCPDETVKLKLLDAKTLEGVLPDGRPVHLAR